MTKVVGHRGASHDYPENTVAAFEGAAAQGADWVELDVRRTSDGVLVVHHDPTLADGSVIAHTAAAHLPPSVPTLEAALAASRPMGVNVEIKNSPTEPGHDPTGELVAATLAVIDAAIAAARPDGTFDVLVSCFDLATVDAVRELHPVVATGYLVLSTTEPHDAVRLAVERGHRAVHPYDLFVDEPTVRRSHDAGIEVNVWTVDHPDRIRQLAEWGVDAVITNRPDVARAALAKG